MKKIFNLNKKGNIQVNTILGLSVITVIGAFLALKMVDTFDMKQIMNDVSICNSGYSYDTKTGLCYQSDDNYDIECSSGYAYQNEGTYKGRCVGYQKVKGKKTYTCPSGYTLNSQNECVSGNISIKAVVASTCPVGDEYYIMDGTCYKIKVSLPIKTKKA